MLSEGPTNDINCSISAVENTLCINVSKANTKFCLYLHHNSSSSYLPLKKVKAGNKNINFPSHFLLGSISEAFDKNESKEVSFKEIVYNFQSIIVLLINLIY